MSLRIYDINIISNLNKNIDEKLNLFHQNGKQNSSLSSPCESTGDMLVVDLYTHPSRRHGSLVIVKPQLLLPSPSSPVKLQKPSRELIREANIFVSGIHILIK